MVKREMLRFRSGRRGSLLRITVATRFEVTHDRGRLRLLRVDGGCRYIIRGGRARGLLIAS